MGSSNTPHTSLPPPLPHTPQTSSLCAPLTAVRVSLCRNLVNVCRKRVNSAGLGKSTQTCEGNGTPLQYACLENSMDGGAWWAAVHGIAESQTRLSDFTFTSTSTFMHWRRKSNPLQCSCLENPRDRGAWWAAVMGSRRVGHD